MKYRKLVFAAAAVALAGPFVPSANADITQDWMWAPHVHVSLDGQAFCDNSHTTIKLWGTFTRDSGMAANVTFTNSLNASDKGKKTVDGSITTNVSVTFGLDDGTPTVYNKNGESGVGGNPYISVGFLADAGPDGVVPIGSRIFVARCVMGASGGNQFKHIDQDFYLSEHVSSVTQQIDCQQKGPAVGLGVKGLDDGLAAEVYLDNNKNKIVHEASDPASGPAGVVTSSLIDHTGYQKGGQADIAGGNPQVDLTWVVSQWNAIPGAPSIHGVRCNNI
jgi:hypothetical protein